MWPAMIGRYTLLVFQFLFVIFLFYNLMNSRETQDPRYREDGGGGSDERQDKITIWASMGLCYSHNTPLKGKEKYPYKEVAPLALLLWRYHLPQVRTIVRIVYTEPELDEARRLHFLGSNNTTLINHSLHSPIKAKFLPQSVDV